MKAARLPSPHVGTPTPAGQAKATAVVLPSKAHGRLKDATALQGSTGAAESQSFTKLRPANHMLAGKLPKPRNAETNAKTNAKAKAKVEAKVEALPVPAALRARLIPVVGARAVDAARLHTDDQAQVLASSHGARAVAEGLDIWFAAGQYRPGTRDGDALIAHELAHVAQAQRGELRGPAFKALSGLVQSPLEAMADQAADQVTAGADLDEQQKQRRKAGQQTALALLPAAGDPSQLNGPGPAAVMPAVAQTGQQTDAAVAADAAAGPAAEAGMAPDQAAAAEKPARTAVPKDLPLMPEPQLSLSPAEKQRAAGVQARAGGTAKATATAPPAKDNVATAQAAVQVPQSESDALAAQKIVAELATKEKPSPEIVALCDRIRTLIREKRPADEDAVVDSRSAEVAQAAGASVEGGVQKDVDGAKASYGAIDAKPAGPAPSTAPGIEPLPADAPTPALQATAATPDAVPPEQVNLDGDAEKMQAKAQDAGLDKESAQLVQGGPVGDARDAQSEMGDLAKQGPAEVLKQQQAALAQSDTDMAALQARALASLKAARSGHVGGVQKQQGEFKGGEEELRTRLAKQAEDVYTGAQTRVQELLRDVPATAMKKWSTQLPIISGQFNDDLKVIKDRIADRHAGVGGFFVGIKDAVAGLPDWAAEGYDRAEKNFGDSVCTLITDISVYVNGIIKIADGIIATARSDIADIFGKNLPDGLKDWAMQQEAAFGKKLDALHQQAEDTRTSFNKELIENAGGAVQAARENVQTLRQEAGGVWGRFLDAVGRFLDNPLKFIIDGLLSLVGISPPAFWALIAKIEKVVSDIVDDPMKFANNLMEGVSRGFSQFFDNIGRHLIVGFLEWLISGMKADGIPIEVPKELSLRSVMGFFLQLLGISWTRIRKLLVEQLGEKAVAMIEKAGGVIQTLATKGISGIFEDIKKMLDPKNIVDAIVDAAIKFITETLIAKVAARILLLFNPAGAIAAAIEAIYRVLKWIFQNAAKLFHFVEAVVNGMADVIAGNLKGVANLVESALAMLVAPVIDFLADYIGLGGLPGKVAESVKGLQAWVEGVMRSVITWLVAMGRKAMAALGIGGKEDKGKEKAGAGGVGERVPFSGGGESHTLYIDVSGASATVMVASHPMTLAHWLDGLQEKLAELAEDDRPKATSLLGQARDQLSKTDLAADKEAAAIQASKTESAEPNAPPAAGGNEVVVDDETQLAGVLAQLAEIFGEEHFAAVPKRLEVTAARVPKPEMNDKLINDLVEKGNGSIHSGAAPDPKLAVKALVDKFGAQYEPKKKVLTLSSASGADLASDESLAAMGQRLASASGAPSVRFAKNADTFELTGEVLSLSGRMAYGAVPGILEDDKVAKVAAERHDDLLAKWTDDVVKSKFKATVRGKPEQEIWLGFAANRQNATQAGVNLLKERVKEKHIDTLERLGKEMREEPTREVFHKDAGDKIAEQAKRYGLGKVEDPKTRTRIESKVEFIYNEQLGRIDTPGSDSDHSEFYPQNIEETIANGKITTTYTTRTGQSYTVTSDEKSRRVEFIEGKNLSLKVAGDPKGRGVVKDSPGFIAGVSLNRSHLIADEFKGSGYAESLNLISASAHYNQVVMRGAERLIGVWLSDNKATSFTMGVTLTWGEVLDPLILAAIKSADWYPREYVPDADLDKAINDRLSQSPDLKRCLAVKYDVTITGADDVDSIGKMKPFGIGPDIWLLLIENEIKQ
jgi:hypothetical protein